jgi:hypothetical protein
MYGQAPGVLLCKDRGDGGLIWPAAGECPRGVTVSDRDSLPITGPPHSQDLSGSGWPVFSSWRGPARPDGRPGSGAVLVGGRSGPAGR